MALAIGIDVGGTKIAGGLVDEAGAIHERCEVRSPANDQDALLDAMVAVASDLDREGCLGAGFGVAGIVNFETGYYLYGPNVGLRDIDMGVTLAERLGTRVVVDNDANAAAWGEYRFGSGRGTRHFLCVTLGTGIGGGIVANGRPYRGARGGAAEIGHMLVDPDGPQCMCGRRGCWEQLASGNALERMAREELATEEPSRLRDMTAGDPDRLRGPMVTDAAREGDALALRVLDRLAVWIGWGLASLVNILEPDRIAIAGGLAADWDLLAVTAGHAMTERMEAPGYRPAPTLVRAELGSDAGLVGAAWLVHESADR